MATIPYKALSHFWIRVLSLAIHVLTGERFCCRFRPSCSEYAQTAMERLGFWRGLYQAFRRLLRCQPWGSSGWDPVKEPVFASGATCPAQPWRRRKQSHCMGLSKE